MLGRTDRARSPGVPLNPTHREPPAEPVLTGVSAIDALTTLVRGQKLPIFSVAGLPHLELAAQIAAQATAGGRAVLASSSPGMGLTHADAAAVRDALEERSAAGELVLLLNTADDPVIERVLTPRIALTVAEDLAFEPRPARAGGAGRHDAATPRRCARCPRPAGRSRRRRAYPGLPLQRPGLALRTLRADPRAGRVGHRASRC